MPKNFEFHKRQFENIHRSTIHFADWLAGHTSLRGGDRILDIACGGGANTFWLGERFPDVHFTGMDYDPDVLNLTGRSAKNVDMVQGDWYNIDPKYVGKFDGIVSFQALSWLSDYAEPIEKLARLRPGWIAVTSLFYEGRINYYTRLEDYEQNFDGWGKDGAAWCNIYSIPMVRELFESLGYRNFDYKKFVMDIDLPKPEGYAMRAYTVKAEDGERIEFAGAMHWPWYFIFASR